MLLERLPIRYQCPICEQGYDSMAQALACRDQPMDWSGWQVGDVCLIPSMRWAKNIMNQAWVAFIQPADPDSLSHFDHVDTHHLWWVVVDLGRDRDDPHRALVTVATEAFGKIYSGWNPANGERHYAMYRPGVPGAEQRAAGGSSWWRDIGDQILAARPSEYILERAAKLKARAEKFSMRATNLLG